MKVERISGVYSDQRFFVTNPNGDQMKVIAVIFVCSIIGGQLEADGVESLELAFFSPKDLPPISARSLQIINDALAENPKVVLS